MLVAGKTNQEIAADLGLDVDSVLSAIARGAETYDDVLFMVKNTDERRKGIFSHKVVMLGAYTAKGVMSHADTGATIAVFAVTKPTVKGAWDSYFAEMTTRIRAAGYPDFTW